MANLDKLRHANGSITTADLRLKMQRCMQNHAAVFRDGPILKKGVSEMKEIYKQFKDVKVIDKCVTPKFAETFLLNINMLICLDHLCGTLT